MLSMILTWLGNLLGGPFAKAAVDAYTAKLNSGNNSERIAAELAAKQAWVDAEKEKLEQQVVIAEEGHWWTAMIRPLFALPFVIFNFKVIVLDRLYGHGFTAELSPGLLDLEKVIVASYFGHAAIVSLGRLVKRA
jgi:hypothetical protein